jgi:competence protein ComEA
VLDTPASPVHGSPLSPEPGDPLIRPRPPRSWRERVEQLADATGTTPARIVAGAALAAVAVGAALWLTRPAATPAEVSLPFASTVPAGAGAGGPGVTSASSTTQVDEELVVDVEGAVLQPGVHRLPAGARVTDALVAAGGLGPTADGARLNLAAPLQDGQRVYVPAVGEDPPPIVGPGAGATGAASDAPTGPLDLNRADAAALDALPGIGPATAAAIIEHRNQIGGFTSVDQLLDVRGIGQAKLDQLRPLVTV